MDRVAFTVAARYKAKKRLDSGNTVYMYSERQIADRNRRKARRLEKLRKSIKSLRAQVKRDLKSEDPERMLTALVVGLIDHTYERVGNEDSADEGHFGVSGWQRKHVSFGRGNATIKYVGKSGVKQTKKVTDAGLIRALRDAYECVEGDDDCLFDQVDAKKVNSYLKTFGVTAKDIRGFHANREMQERLRTIRSKGGSLPEDKKEREKKLKDEFKKALEETAGAVGHEASTLRSQYLIPNIEADFLKDGTISTKMVKQAGRVPPGWTESKGTTGRSFWTSPDGKTIILDAAGRPAIQRYMVLYIRGGKQLEDIGWPSLSAAIAYVEGKKTLRDHPLHKRAEEYSFGAMDPNERDIAYSTTPWNIDRHWDGSPIAGGAISETASYVEGFFRRHPKLSKYHRLKILDKEGTSSHHPEAQQHGNEIWLFPKFWKLRTNRLKDFVFTHEIGHWVLTEFSLAKMIELAGEFGIDPWDTPSLPFAQFNMHEAFADCFATYHLDRSELRQRYPEWEKLVEAVLGRSVTAAYSEDTLELVAAGMALLLAQNYIVTNPFFNEKEIRKYLTLRRQFHGDFIQACHDLADEFEKGTFGSAVQPAVPALRAIGQLSARQEQQALRQMVRAFRGLRNISWRDVEDRRVLKLISMARRLNVDTEQYDTSYQDFLKNLVRMSVIPAGLRTLIRKVLKMPTPGKRLVETTNPGAWFDMDSEKKQNLRELAERTQKEQDAIYEIYKDDPEKRIELYRSTADRLQKIQNIAGVNLGIITKEDEEPLDQVLRREAKLDSDGPTEYVRLQVEEYVKSVGAYRYQRKEGEPLPREVGKLLTTLKKAKTFPTMRRIIQEAIERKILGTGSIDDIENILAQAGKNKAIREGKPLIPLQFDPKTPEEFQVDHDTGDVEFDPEYTEDERKELLGRVSRAISDLEGIYGKGFCGKHAKKLAFRFRKFEGTAKAHYFTWDDKQEWQPRVTFGPDYEGVLAHELSHYLEDLLAYRIQSVEYPEHQEDLQRKGIQGGPGNIFGMTGVPLHRLGKEGVLSGSRERLGKTIPELVEFIDVILSTPDYQRWSDKLGSAYDTALPMAVKALTGMDYWDLPKDHPYYGIIEKAQYRSQLPSELNEETQKQYKALMGGDDRKLSYYNSAIEVWARMCEQYVYETLIDAGISNPWLTWMNYEDDVFMDEKTFNEKLRPVMDRIFAKLKDRKLLARVIARYLAHAS